MGWNFTDCVETYAAATQRFLAQRPAEHTVQLTVIETLRAGVRTSEEAPLFGWWSDESGIVQGACSYTPPFNMLLTDLPNPALDTLAPEVHRRSSTLPGVMGLAEVAIGFADRWAEKTASTPSVSMRQRLYRLGSLSDPHPMPPGAPRRADTTDRRLLIGWFEAFGSESGATAVDVSPVVDDRLEFGGVVLWETDGTPVSLAARTRTAAGVARIGSVYTPEEHRRRGYGAAVTAAATRAALEAGASEVVLFTDLANPTSNAIYQSIGFEPVSDRLEISFSPGSGEEA